MRHEPEPVTVRRWRCPFCRRSRSSKKLTAEHITRCWKNPLNRACKSCANYRYYPGAGVPDPCIPGRPCNCEQDEMTCEAGIEIEPANFPVTDCPLWKLREAP